MRTRIPLPKPLHGWRAFAGEVGVIVLGVLIALGAQQLVEKWQWRRDVRDFRAAVDNELQFNLAASDYRVRQSPCVRHRLAELERWSAELRSGQASPLVREISFPRRIVVDMAVWNSRGADLPAHLPMKARVAYSDLYDLVDNQRETISAERETWLALNGFNHVHALGPTDLIRLDELIFRARRFDRAIAEQQKLFGYDVAILRLHPSFGQYASQVSPPPADFCKPVLPANDEKPA